MLLTEGSKKREGELNLVQHGLGVGEARVETVEYRTRKSEERRQPETVTDHRVNKRICLYRRWPTPYHERSLGAPASGEAV